MFNLYLFFRHAQFKCTGDHLVNTDELRNDDESVSRYIYLYKLHYNIYNIYIYRYLCVRKIIRLIQNGIKVLVIIIYKFSYNK